jgi:hypothetical protein
MMGINLVIFKTNKAEQMLGFIRFIIIVVVN